tara:strand:+ start:1098 stop:1538 length:441 start_codon:yes stop_codon:yes gene_type:complete
MNKKQLIECEEKLRELDYIGYGLIVPRNILEGVLNLKYSDSMKWIGPMIELRCHLHERGYFLSERGMDVGSIRFLRENEIPKVLHRRRLSRYKHMASDLNVAKKLPMILLSNKDEKNMLHEMDRLSRDLFSITRDDEELRKSSVED